MAEIISIKVNVNDTDYKRTTGRLLEIQKYVDTLNKTPIHIKIDNAGFDKVTKQITAYNNSVARMVKAENELTIAKEKTAQAQAKAEAEAWKAEQADIRRSAAREAREARAAAATQKRIESEEKLKEQAYLEAEKHRQDQVRRDDKALADAEKRAQKEAEAFKKSYEQQAQAAEKHRQEQIKRDQQAAAEAEKNARRQAAAQEKAAGSVDTLRKNYANLLRQIENLKEKYPEGTFDDIEREAREAGEEVRHLDANSKTLVGDVDRLSGTYKKLTADLAQTKAEHKAEASVMEENTAVSSLLNNSLGNLILQYFSLRNIVNHLVSAFRDALKTMKEVDSELVTIQKTTGYSGERLDRLTESAYELASAYGRTATEILNAASVYARAGFKENLEDMTELSALLQNVGDLTGEAAAKFLVATNAAWQMNGSYENLLRVIDGLNQQTNEAAVDMDALTSGITVAGSVFSNAGESVQTFAGLLGAGVALTQRSGSEIGRGLRTIAMNIRQIKGELDDGEIIDEASISDAAKALHSVGISVADANGELRLTSDVLTDLAAKWGSLTTAEQSYLSQSLAGKRQANILNALMKNWQEVERQMTLYANGAGSAMKENEIYLDSWEAKTKQLDAAWTEFVANLVDTDLIKGALDALITLVNLLDSDFGHFLVTAVAIPTVLLTIASLIGKITAAVGLLGTALMPILGVVAGGVAIAGLVALADALTTSAQEYADAVKEAEDAYARTQGQIEDLKRRESELTDIERHKLAILQEQARIQAEEVRRAKVAQYNDEYGDGDANQTARDMIHQYQAYQRRMELTSDPKEYEKLEQGLDNVNSRILTMYSSLLDFKEALGTLPEDGEEAIATLQGFVGIPEEINDAKDSLEELLKEVRRLGIDINKTVYGNIDTNNRQILEWTQENLDKYKTAIESWGYELEDLAGSISTVMGASAEFDGVEIAFSPILQTPSGPVLLTEEAVDKYIYSLIAEAGEGWTSEELFALDAKGLEIDGIKIKNLLADIGATAAKTGEAMHYVGRYGALALAGLPLTQTAAGVKALSDRLKELSEKATSFDTVIAAVINAMENFGAESYEVNQAMKNLETIIPGSTSKMYDFDTATVITEEDIWGSKEALLNFIDTQKQIEFSEQIDELEKLANGYLDVAEAALTAMVNQQAQAQMSGVLAFTTGGVGGATYGADLANANKEKANWDAYVATLRARSSYRPDTNTGRGSYTPVSSAPENTKDAELERLRAIVSLEKAELSFLQASGKSLDEINAKRKVIQAALHDEAEYLRAQLEILKAEEVAEEDKAEHEAKIKALEEDILALSTEWWNIQKNINDDLAKAEEEKRKAEEERLKAIEEENKRLEEQKKLQQEMFDTLKKQVDDYYAKLIEDKEKELTLEERILAVQQAEAALANAQRERTVRYYNAATGQWEWQANAKNVKSAQDALKKAQDDLNKYQREQAWKEFKSAWEYVSEQIRAGAMTFQEAYDYMYREMKRIQDTYGVDLGGTLEDSIGGFRHLNYGIDGLTQEVANSLGASVGVLNEKLKQYEDAVGAFKDAFDEASDKVKNGEMSMEDAYSYLRDRAKEIADKYGIDMTGALEEAIAGMDKTNMSIDELWKAVIINLMKVNSARWFDANDEERAMLHAQNEYLGRLIGATYDPSGYWYLNGSQLYGSQKGVDYSGKTSGWGNYTGSGGGYGISSGGGGSYGGGGAIGASGGVAAIRGAAGTGMYYDSYGNTYTTLEDAAKGNAALSQAGSNKNRYYGKAFETIYNKQMRWTDPEAWAEYSRLMEADPEYAAKLTELEAMVENGASQDEITAMINSLYSGEGGTFGSIQKDGMTTGWTKAGYGNANGEHLLILNGKLYQSGVNPGTMLQDLWGNRWEVGEDGHTLTPMDAAWAQGMMDLANSDLGMSAETSTPPLPASSEAVTTTTTNNTSGDTYNINGIRIGAEDAAKMTLTELAHLAAGLGSFNR